MPNVHRCWQNTLLYWCLSIENNLKQFLGARFLEQESSQQVQCYSLHCLVSLKEVLLNTYSSLRELVKTTLPHSFLKRSESTAWLQLCQGWMNTKVKNVCLWLLQPSLLFNVLYCLKLIIFVMSSNNNNVPALSYLKHRCMLWSLASVWCQCVWNVICFTKYFMSWSA